MLPLVMILRRIKQLECNSTELEKIIEDQNLNNLDEMLGESRSPSRLSKSFKQLNRISERHD
jgi:hypothetical protein